MTLAIIYSRANTGMEAPLVTVETHLSNGLPSMTIVGLPEAAVRESRERVRSAILNSGLEFPARRITINLAPADLPKSGGRFDLAIALGILTASGQLPADSLEACEILGELALNGELRPVDGVLPAVLAARLSGRSLLLPAANASEAELVRGVRAFSAPTLDGLCVALQTRRDLSRCRFRPERLAAACPSPDPDMIDIRGQEQARRALEVAAAGGHNLLLVGPPGTGKTLLARAFHGLLPALTEDEAVAVAAVRSVAGLECDPLHWTQVPFRAPHHSASVGALAGGGRRVMPGEISLAHKGVLFLDELGEFDRRALETLREPLESASITLSRASYRVAFPAGFQLVGAMNPCPCGYRGDESGYCRCTPERIEAYRHKISGPLLDRIDLQILVPRPAHDALLSPPRREVENSAVIRERVQRCRQRQFARAACLNARLGIRSIDRDCALDEPARRLMVSLMEQLQLSARASHRILKVARTVADLREAGPIGEADIAEAVALRQFSPRLRN